MKYLKEVHLFQKKLANKPYYNDLSANLLTIIQIVFFFIIPKITTKGINIKGI